MNVWLTRFSLTSLSHGSCAVQKLFFFSNLEVSFSLGAWIALLGIEPIASCMWGHVLPPSYISRFRGVVMLCKPICRPWAFPSALRVCFKVQSMLCSVRSPLALLEFQLFFFKLRSDPFWIDFVQGERNGSGFILLHVDVQFSGGRLLRRLSFTQSVCWHCCHRLGGYAVWACLWAPYTFSPVVFSHFFWDIVSTCRPAWPWTQRPVDQPDLELSDLPECWDCGSMPPCSAVLLSFLRSPEKHFPSSGLLCS